MPPVETEGLYQANIKDHAVTTTRKNELPQFVGTFLVKTKYNDATEEWEDWSAYELTITGYFVLMTLNEQGLPKKCLNYDQVVEATGWDGETFASLHAMDLKDVGGQIRVASEEYNGKTSLKVKWIAGENAEIGLRKLDSKELSKLDAKFGLQANKAASPENVKKRSQPAKAKPALPAAPKPAAQAPATEKVEPCNEDVAYQACLTANEALEKSVPSEILDDYWTGSRDEIAKDPTAITDLEYGQIRNAVLEKLNIPF